MQHKLLIALCINFIFGTVIADSGTAVLLNRPVIDDVLGFDAESVWTVALFELEGENDFTFVDRKNIHKMLNEMSLGVQTLANPETSAQIGNFVGAHYFVNVRGVKNKDSVLLTLQTVHVATSQTQSGYRNVKADSMIDLGKEIAALTREVLAKANNNEPKLQGETPEAFRLSPDAPAPTLAVWIPETHINQPVVDPAAEIEITRRLIAAGFSVRDLAMHEAMESDGGTPLETASRLGRSEQLDYVIYGEAFSELADRIGAFEGVRARVEIKIVDVKTGKVIFSDSSHAGAVDLAESTAAKAALMKAGAQLAEKLMPVLATND